MLDAPGVRIQGAVLGKCQRPIASRLCQAETDACVSARFYQHGYVRFTPLDSCTAVRFNLPVYHSSACACVTIGKFPDIHKSCAFLRRELPIRYSHIIKVRRLLYIVCCAGGRRREGGGLYEDGTASNVTNMLIVCFALNVLCRKLTTARTFY